MILELITLYFVTVAIDFLLMAMFNIYPSKRYGEMIGFSSLIGTVIIVFLALIKFIKGV